MNFEIGGLEKLFGNKKEAKERNSELEIIKKGLEADILRMESDPNEAKGMLGQGFTEMIRMRRLDYDSRILNKDEGRSEAERTFNEKLLSKWKGEFWHEEEKYAEIAEPNNAIEQSIIWNSCEAPLSGKVMDGFKQVEQIKTDKKDLNKEGILPEKKRKTEITVVDRAKDKELDDLCRWAGKLKEEIPDEEQRIFVILKEVFKRMDGRTKSGDALKDINKRAEENKEVLLGDVGYGRCGQRNLLFHILVYEAGIMSRSMKAIVENTEDVFPHPLEHFYEQVFLRNSGEILIADAVYFPEQKGEKHFEELTYQEFKAQGGFPCFGSNRLPFKFYQNPKYIEKFDGFQGGRLGIDGLDKFLQK